MLRLARKLLPALSLIVAFASIVPVAHAQYRQQDIGTLNKPVEPFTFGEVGVDETKLGNTIPAGLAFRDETGQVVHLSDYLGHGRPVILWMGYYECPMLCDLMSAGMVKAVKDIKLDAGKEFSILNVSINPNESAGLANLKKQRYLKELGQPGNASAWNLLTGSPESIHSLADAVGYKFKKVTVDGEAQYAHPAVLMVLSPQGKLTRYLYPNNNQGVQFDARTMQLSLIEASDNQVGTIVDRVLLTCLHYDARSGKYTWFAIGLMRWAGALTVLVMLAVLLPIWIRAARAKPNADDLPPRGGVLT